MIRVEKIVPGGFGLGVKEDGKKVFLWNALPGESVEEFLITKNKSRYEEALALKIINPSKFRVNPKDACYLSTSPWQIIDFDYENQLKSELVAESFREEKIAINPPKVLTDGKDYFYRNKMEYSLYYSHETKKIELAFRARGSHQKVPINQSSIERPEIFARASEIVNELNEKQADARKYQSLLLRCSQDGKVEGGLYENNKPHQVFPNLTDTILGQKYSYSPNGFFQINLPVYELALKEIKKHITTRSVLDLYAGVGTIGLSVARDRSLTLVESDKYAFTELKKNCEMLNRNAPRAIAGKSNSLSKEPPLAILEKSENMTDYIAPDSTVILDPPRAGCDKTLIEKLNEIIPEKIIYLSCNPSTQARDVKNLINNYEIEAIVTFNFFPHTPHIENLVILSKK